MAKKRSQKTKADQAVVNSAIPAPSHLTVTAACKFTASRTIEKSDLPVTCLLQEHPGNLNIALAELFDSGGKPTVLTLSADGLSFVIPNSIAAGDWTLAVRVQGGPDPIPSIHVVEDCDASQRILTITDPTSKAAIQDIKVHG